MKKISFVIYMLSVYAYAHFGVALPSKNIVEEQKDAKIDIKLSFMHPFEQTYMKLEKPEKVYVVYDKKAKDLSGALKKDKNGWNLKYNLNEPATYQFYFVPKPYFEKSEGKFIQHITKTYVDAYGAGDWQTPAGLKAEIVPLTRPFGLYCGSLFRGQVLHNGKVAKNAIVEIELYNDKHFKAPSDAHITQEVLTDSNGIFSFTLPQAGWWGFAALLEDDKTLSHKGKKYPIELGAVLWIKADEWQK